MVKNSTDQNFVSIGLSYLALSLNFLEQIGLITSKFSIFPNFFVQTGGLNTQMLAGFTALILCGVVISFLLFGFSSGLNFDFRGLVIKKGKTFSEDKTISIFWTIILVVIVEVILTIINVSIGLGAISNQSVWLQYSIQLLVYVLFWVLLTYFLSFFLKDHLNKSKFEEDRKRYIYDLFETIERSNAIKGDSKLSVKATFVIQYTDRLNFVVARNAYFLVQTSYNASELKYVLEVPKVDFEKELNNLICGGIYPINKIQTSNLSTPGGPTTQP